MFHYFNDQIWLLWILWLTNLTNGNICLYNSLKEYNLPLHFKFVIESPESCLPVDGSYQFSISFNKCKLLLFWNQWKIFLHLNSSSSFWILAAMSEFYLINYTLYIEWLIVLFVSLNSFQRSVISTYSIFLSFIIFITLVQNMSSLIDVNKNYQGRQHCVWVRIGWTLSFTIKTVHIPVHKYVLFLSL